MYIALRYLVAIKIPQNSDNKPWAYICSEGFFAGLIFGGVYFRYGISLQDAIVFIIFHVNR